MFLTLKLILIILLNNTYARYITQNSEIILLPTYNLSTGAKEISLTLKAFGKQIQLNLRRNDHIVSSKFKVWKHNIKGITEKLSQLNALDLCYYLHQDDISIAAVNFCQKHGLEGIVFLENTTLEIIPLQTCAMTSSSLIDESCVETEMNVSLSKPHLIKRSLKSFADMNLFHVNDLKSKRRHLRSTPNSLTIELAVFLDSIAYNWFLPTLDGDNKKIRNMLLAYVNGIQALFQHPSFGVPINISLTYLLIFQENPPDMTYFGSDAIKLLDSFCNYTKVIGNEYKESSVISKITEPNHWDISLYLTGFDLYKTVENEKISSITSFSTINGSCTPLSCAVVEYGVMDGSNNPTTSTGFTSIYNAVREIGHSLGIKDDSKYNMTECSKGSYIMSPKQSFRSKVWSVCSRRIAETLSQTKHCLLDTLPETSIVFQYIFKDETTSLFTAYDRLDYENDIKKEWTAKKQCELFLHNKNANVVTLHDACQSLQCEWPENRRKPNEYFFAGPALDGTYCAPGKECYYGECVSIFK